ncbi:MAG: sn-glycerol-1-phosphate dehydrogenase [Rickettsiales bacterium]|nr:sn-glycerol-1-phosphate dehydrogenase [Rickettsiales bacterium]
MPIIENLITGKLSIPEELNAKPITTRKIEISSGAIKHLPNFLENYFSNKKDIKIAIVSDDRTHLVAGAALESMLASNKQFQVYSVIIPDNINASIENVDLVSAYSANCDLLIAVGSGTINDLCKYSSYKMGKDYIVVPTAPSVNGYTSSTASIEVEGLKKSLEAHLPIAIFMDIDILVLAPERLIISGFGDSLATYTARADWLLSNFVFGTKYNEFIYDILKDEFSNLLKVSNKILARDFEAMKTLSRVLILSGFGMHLAGSSAPASGAEHLISHYIEMMYKEEIPHTYHGEQIAVTTIAVAKLQEKILQLDELQINPIIHTQRPILKNFGEEIGAKLISEIKNKEIGDAKCEEINRRLKSEWKNLREKILSHYISADDIEDKLKHIKGPFTYKHLGWNNEQFQNAFYNSVFLRNRFTFLDLAMGLIGKFDMKI